MKIETQMIQNSIFTFKRTDEQNGSLHQHKSTFVVIDYYQGFKLPFLRLILREFKRKKTGDLGGLHKSGVQNGANATNPKRISIKFTTNPRTKQKMLLQTHNIYNKAYTPTTNY